MAVAAAPIPSAFRRGSNATTSLAADAVRARGRRAVCRRASSPSGRDPEELAFRNPGHASKREKGRSARRRRLPCRRQCDAPNCGAGRGRGLRAVFAGARSNPRDRVYPPADFRRPARRAAGPPRRRACRGDRCPRRRSRCAPPPAQRTERRRLAADAIRKTRTARCPIRPWVPTAVPRAVADKTEKPHPFGRRAKRNPS